MEQNVSGTNILKLKDAVRLDFNIDTVLITVMLRGKVSLAFFREACFQSLFVRKKNI